MTKTENEGKSLTLTGDCSIYEASELCDAFKTALSNTSSLMLDMSGIERVDASFLQILLSLKLEAEKHNVSINFGVIPEMLSSLANGLNCHEFEGSK